MRFEKLVKILQSMQRPKSHDIWDSERIQGKREGYNQCLADVIKTIEVELQKEAATKRNVNGHREDKGSDTVNPPD